MRYCDIVRKMYDEKSINAPVKDEYSVCREVIQELILRSLTKTDFYEKAAFHGGTFIRLFHDCNRFSEDLDFEGLQKDTSFVLEMNW